MVLINAFFFYLKKKKTFKEFHYHNSALIFTLHD